MNNNLWQYQISFVISESSCIKELFNYYHTCTHTHTHTYAYLPDSKQPLIIYITVIFVLSLMVCYN